MNANRDPLTPAADIPVLSVKTAKTAKLQRPQVVARAPMTVARAPVYGPAVKPTGAVAIHVKEEAHKRRFIARAPRPLNPDLLCTRCGQRTTNDGCLCNILVQDAPKH